MDLSGATPTKIKHINRGMVLRLILMGVHTSRVDISRELKLTKTTLTNIVSDLIKEGIIEEISNEESSYSGVGRKSIELSASKDAPVICGILLRRKKIIMSIGDIEGNLVEKEEYIYAEDLTIEILMSEITDMYQKLREKTSRRIFTVGISSLGPVDIYQGVLLKPQRFYTDKADFPIVDFIEKLIGVPTFLCHDVSAAALAEKISGNMQNINNFIYVSTIHGIGAGLFLDSKIYNGVSGHNGELGHISIDYRGEVCECGRRGCVEKYVNFDAMKERAKLYEEFYPNHPIYKQEDIGFFDIILLAERDDILALILLKEYCQYLGYAITSLTTALGVDRVIISNILEAKKGVFEKMLEKEINKESGISSNQYVVVEKSGYGLQAPLYGAFAVIMEKVFQGELYFDDTLQK